MTRSNLPTYAIVELLIRLAHINPFIGDYKDHLIYDDGFVVKTNRGTITFSKDIIMQQFHDPDQITDNHLVALAGGFSQTAK